MISNNSGASKSNEKYLSYGSQITIKLASAEKYLSSQSFLSRICVFKSDFSDEGYDSAIFIIESIQMIGNNNKGEAYNKANISESVNYVNFANPFYLKHKQTNRYLGLKSQPREEVDDTLYELEIKDDPADRNLFRINQCYLYQKKISNFAKPAQQLYLVAQLRKSAKQINLICIQSEEPVSQALCGFNSRRALVFNFFSATQLSNENFSFGHHVYLNHTQTQTYLNTTPALRFEPFSNQKDNNIRGVWRIESEALSRGGDILFQQKIRLRNIYTQKYLSFDSKPIIVGNQKTYLLILQDHPDESTVFRIFHLKGKDGYIKQTSYFILQHALTSNYISSIFPLQSSALAHPKDVYKFELVPQDRIWSFNLVIAIEIELQKLANKPNIEEVFFSLAQSLSLTQSHLDTLEKNEYEEFVLIQRTFSSILNLLVNTAALLWDSMIKKNTVPPPSNTSKTSASKLMIFSNPQQSRQPTSIRNIPNNETDIEALRLDPKNARALALIKQILMILTKLCLKNTVNKNIVYQKAPTLVKFLCLDVYTEQLLQQLFRENLQLVLKIDKNLEDGWPLLHTYIFKLNSLPGKYSENHVKVVLKFIELCKIITCVDGQIVSYAQTYITSLLFDNNAYKEFLFEITIKNQRIKVCMPQMKDIEEIPERSHTFSLLLDEIKLFTRLCQKRNLIAKSYMVRLFSSATLLNYLQMRIPESLKSLFFEILTNVYVDSSPRSLRPTPSHIIELTDDIPSNAAEQILSQEESALSEKLSQKLIQNNFHSNNNARSQLGSTKKLSLNNIIENGNFEYVIDAQQVNLYRMILQERIQGRSLSVEMFQALETLMELNYLEPDSISKIFALFKENMESNDKNNHKLYRLLHIVSNNIDEIYLDKAFIVAKIIFMACQEFKISFQDLFDKMLQYILPSNKPLNMQILLQKEEVPEPYRILAKEYNKYSKMLDIKQAFIDELIPWFLMADSHEEKNLLYSLIRKWYFKSKHFLVQIYKSIVLTSPEQIQLVNYLHTLYKKLSRLNQSSEVWLRNNNSKNRAKLLSFCAILSEVNAFFYESYKSINPVQQNYDVQSENTDHSKKPEFRTINYPQVSCRRQIIIKNMGFAEIVFSFLEESFFVLEMQEKYNILCKAFFYSFQFLHAILLKKNNENKKLVNSKITTLSKYLDYYEVGQTIVLSELYSDDMDLAKKQEFALVQKVFKKIVELPKFDPQLLDIVYNSVDLKGQIYMPNLSRLVPILSDSKLLQKILFLVQSRQRTASGQVIMREFNLDPQGIIGGHLPYLFHARVLKLLNLMFQHVHIGLQNIQEQLLDQLSGEYLLSIMSLSDHYSEHGIQAKLNFILKTEVAKLLLAVYLPSNHTFKHVHLNEAVNSFLKRTLEQLARIEKGTKEFPVTTAMSSLLNLFQNKLLSYTEQLTIPYETYVTSNLSPIVKLLKGRLEKRKQSENYRLADKLDEQLAEYVNSRTGLARKDSSAAEAATPLYIKSQILESDPNQIYKIINFPLPSIFNSELIRFKQVNNLNKSIKDPVSLQENTRIQQFANTFYCTLLFNQSISRRVGKESEDFCSVLATYTPIRKSIDVLLQFIHTLSQEVGSQTYLKQASLQTLSDCLNLIGLLIQNLSKNQTQIIESINKKELVRSLLNMIMQKSYNMVQPEQNILCFSLLRFLNTLLSKEQTQDIIKSIADIFETNKESYRLFSLLKDTLLEFSSIKNRTVLDRYNQAFGCLKFNFITNQISPKDTLEIAMNFISSLSTKSEIYPFTDFFRKQKSQRISTDFLPILVNCVYFALFNKQTNTITITTANFELIRLILKTILNMLYGPNPVNQTFLAETRFPALLIQIIKLDRIDLMINEPSESQNLVQRRVEDVLKVYPKLLSHIAAEYSRQKSTHPVLLNRTKFYALEVVKEMVNANQACLRRLTLVLPEEYLKVNLIWVYNLFLKEQNGRYARELLMDDPLDLEKIIKEPESHGQLTMPTGFVTYQLIQLYQEADQLDNNDLDKLISDDQKKQDRKVQLVKKFFTLLKPKKLEQQPILPSQQIAYSKEIKKYRDQYKSSLDFFSQKTLSIEVMFQKKLYKIYFPKLPICEFFTKEHQQKFREEANRISQSSKLHSLMEIATDTIDDVIISEQFNTRLTNVSPYLVNFFNYDLVLLISLMMGLIISTLVLIIFVDNTFSIPMLEYQGLPHYTVTWIFGLLGLFVALILFLMLVFKQIPLSITQAKRLIAKRQEEEEEELKTSDHVSILLSQIFKGSNVYLLFVIIMIVLTSMNPIFSCFLLLELFRRIETASNILKAIAETWKQLLAGTLIFVAMNYIYAFLFYIVYFDIYSPTCTTLYQCFLLLNDTFFKNGPGFYGGVAKNYIGYTINLQSIVDATYIIFICVVIKEIFSGTIIDKFSQLRQRKEAIIEDEESVCYICGLARQELDFELEGFDQHNQHTHNPLYYIFYIFYLRTKDKTQYTRLEKYVSTCIANNSDMWFPNQTSTFKEKKKQLNKDLEHQEKDFQMADEGYLQRDFRMKIIKQMKKVMDGVISDLKHTS